MPRIDQSAKVETLLVTPRFSVQRHAFQLPSGRPVVREFVIHPGAVTILPLLGDGSIIMARQVRRGVGTELLELAAGTLEPNEAPIETARRELEEETGYRAGRIRLFTEFFTSPGIMSERMHAFIATDLQQVGQNLDEGEQIEVVVLPASDVRRMLVAGEFCDAKTVAVLATYFLRMD